MRILLVCNYKGAVGGISGQVELLQRHLLADGYEATIFSTKGSLAYRLRLPWKAERRMKDCDVVHVHCCSGWGFLPAVVGVSAAKRMKKRVVVTYHGGGAAAFFDKHPRLVHAYLGHADVNIVLNSAQAQVFARHHLLYTVLPNITDCPAGAYRPRDAMKPNYVCTRAHEDIYDISTLLRAFARVQQAYPEATLTLVGDGSRHGALQAEAASLGLKNVLFAGRVPNHDIYQYLDRADIMVSPSTVDNMPVSVLEGMNAGLLVIASHVGGVPDMIRDGDTGMLFEPGNADMLAERMLWPLEHGALASTTARQGHHAASRFCWEAIREPLYKIYGIRS